MNNKFEIQNTLYTKPYHHFVSFNENDLRIFDSLPWGVEYFGYISFIINKYFKQANYDHIAEVGCGDAKILCEIAKICKNAKLYGYDLSIEAVKFAQAYCMQYENVKIYADNFRNAKQKFDAILCVETLEHIHDDDLTDFLTSIKENMKIESNLIISVPTTNIPLNKKHYRHYDLKLLKEQTNHYFEIIDVNYVHNPNTLYKVINAIMYNRFYILNVKLFRKYLFKLYTKYSQITTENKGSHLVAVLKLKK